MVTDFNNLFLVIKIYCADHFVVYTNMESLGCVPETDIMLYINYISIKKEYI